MLIGLGIVVAVLLIQDRGFLQTDRDDAAGDDLLTYLADVLVQENEPPYPFALITIDEQTYRDWKEPLITPRDKLAEIIEFAIEGQAKLIFIDIELSRLGDGTPVSEWLKSSSAQRMRNPDEPAKCDQLRPVEKADAEPCDRKVAQTKTCDQLRLSNADTKLCEVVTQTGSVPIVLPRTIVAAPDSRPGEERWEAQPSFLDPIVGLHNESARGVHWASPLYSLDSDRFVRRWRLWELVCENSELKENSKLRAIPSVELRAFALLDQNSYQNAQMSKQLTDVMTRIPEGDCVDRKTNLDLLDPFKLRSSNGRVIQIDLTPQSPRDRILYSIGWWTEEARLYADQSMSERRPQVNIPGTNRKTDLVTTISARTITEVTDSVKPDRSIVKDHVVVIGVTHREAGDLHETPLGLMPGSLIIINAIHSLQQYGQLPGLSFWLGFALAVLMMIACVLAYHLLWDELCELVFPQIFLLAAFINILFVYEGIWINVALPAVIYSSVMNFWHLRKELIERAAAKRDDNLKLKWRAWLGAFLNEKTFDRD